MMIQPGDDVTLSTVSAGKPPEGQETSMPPWSTSSRAA